MIARLGPLAAAATPAPAAAPRRGLGASEARPRPTSPRRSDGLRRRRRRGRAAARQPRRRAPPAAAASVERSAQITLATTPRDIDGASARSSASPTTSAATSLTSQRHVGRAAGRSSCACPSGALAARARSACRRSARCATARRAAQDITAAVVSVRVAPEGRARPSAEPAQAARARRRRPTRPPASARACASCRGEIAAAKQRPRRASSRRAALVEVAVTLVADAAGGAAGGAAAGPRATPSTTPAACSRSPPRVLLVAGAVALPLGLVAAARLARRRVRPRTGGASARSTPV